MRSRESRVGIPASSATAYCYAALLFALSVIAGCSSLSTVPAPVIDRKTVPAEVPKPIAKPSEGGVTLKRGGGFYKDDGPGENPPQDMEAITDAVPRAEPLNRFANKPYTVLGRDYVPMQEVGRYKTRGLASWYGKKFHGQKTSTGEVYDMYGMTAAHATLPIPSYARVTSMVNGKSVVVRVNDRGPFHPDRIIDLSYTAAWKLGLVGGGSGEVVVESLLPGESLPIAPTPPAQLAIKSEEPAAPKAIEDKPLPEIDDAHGSWLQLGAFGSRDNAEALKSKLARELGDMGDKLVVRTTGKISRVQLGPWADAQEARNMAEKVADLLQMKPVLVQLP